MNTIDEMNEYLASLSDEELREKLKTAVLDLQVAAMTQPGSDWHDCCFAGVVALGDESLRRSDVAKGIWSNHGA